MSYISKALRECISKTPNEIEFHQAAEEVLSSLNLVIGEDSEFEKLALLERLLSPERVIIFRVPWVDDNDAVRINTGYRVQFNSAIGPYKGGMRFHPSVNLSILKFLAFEQTLKNALTSLPIGGGKGGSDFDPKGKSDFEVMRFCQSLVTELSKHIGKDTDVPAGDIGVGAREIGYMFGQYKRLANVFDGSLTGKGIEYGGSLVRTEATGYGLVYIVEEMLGSVHKAKNKLEGAKVVISGSGNVAVFACEKAIQMGAKVIAMSDTNGFVYDKNGINLNIIKNLKLVERKRISEYVKFRDAEYTSGRGIWGIPCDIALPCATQNELDELDAKNLVNNGCYAVAEGSNMPCSKAAIEVFHANKTLFIPGKAANAGGVATSALEMSQNSIRQSWSFEEVDHRLKEIMKNIFAQISEYAERYSDKEDYLTGANAVAFLRVANAMMAQGIV